MRLKKKINALLHPRNGNEGPSYKTVVYPTQRGEEPRPHNTEPVEHVRKERERYGGLLALASSNAEYGKFGEWEKIYNSVVAQYGGKLRKDVAEDIRDKLKAQFKDAKDPTFQQDVTIELLLTVTAVENKDINPINLIHYVLGNGGGYEIAPTLHQLFPLRNNGEADKAFEELVNGRIIALIDGLYTVTPKIKNHLNDAGYQITTTSQ